MGSGNSKKAKSASNQPDFSAAGMAAMNQPADHPGEINKQKSPQTMATGVPNQASSQIKQTPNQMVQPGQEQYLSSHVQAKPEEEMKFRQRVQQGGEGEEEEERLNEVLETPGILFYFDFREKMFYYYDIRSNAWDQNDLTLAKDDCPRCPLFKFREDEEEEAVKFAKYMSYIAFSDEVIYIIGGYNTFFSCLEYNIPNNTFSLKKPLKVYRNNPSLCKYSRYVYAVSGDFIDTFSKDVSMYDTVNDQWTILQSLPQPQGFAAARVIYESKAALDLHETSFEPKYLNQNYEKNLKIAVLGGLSAKFPKTYAPFYSLYSFHTDDWRVFDLSKIFTTRIPRFINCTMVQRREGDLIIAGCEGTRNVFRFDIENMQITPSGKLPNQEAFSNSMMSKESLYRYNMMFCLAHSLEMRIYQGYLDSEEWELV